MNLKEYFLRTPGRGILATSNSRGEITMAIYSGPYFTEDGTLAFIAAERETYRNLQTNPNACFMYIEAGGWFSGKRLYLKKKGESQSQKLIKDICEQCYYFPIGNPAKRHVVLFDVVKVLPLVGAA